MEMPEKILFWGGSFLVILAVYLFYPAVSEKISSSIEEKSLIEDSLIADSLSGKISSLYYIKAPKGICSFDNKEMIFTQAPQQDEQVEISTKCKLKELSILSSEDHFMILNLRTESGSYQVLFDTKVYIRSLVRDQTTVEFSNGKRIKIIF